MMHTLGWIAVLAAQSGGGEGLAPDVQLEVEIVPAKQTWQPRETIEGMIRWPPTCHIAEFRVFWPAYSERRTLTRATRQGRRRELERCGMWAASAIPRDDGSEEAEFKARVVLDFQGSSFKDSVSARQQPASSDAV